MSYFSQMLSFFSLWFGFWKVWKFTLNHNAYCGRLLALLLYRWTVYNKAPPLLLALSLSEYKVISKYSSLSTIKFCKARTTFRLWSDTYSLNIFLCIGIWAVRIRKKTTKLIILCNVPRNILYYGLTLWREIRKNLWKKTLFNDYCIFTVCRDLSYFLQKIYPASAGWQFDGMELFKTNFNNCDFIITKQLQYVRISPCRCATSECRCSVCSSKTMSGHVQDMFM